MTTHTEHSARKRNSAPCSAHHITFGGRCLNCGWDPELPLAGGAPRATPGGMPRIGIVEQFKAGFWIVRHGTKPAEIEHLRPWQFCFSATSPQIRPNPQHCDRLDGRDIWPGQTVILHYIIARGVSLWYAYPTTQEPATPPATA